MAWDKGFNFRSTLAFVTDGTDETHVIEPSYYPTTRNSVTFGWVTLSGQGQGDVQTRDRDAGVDRRLAGTCFFQNQATDYFQVDLPAAGPYTIYIAMGDASFATTAGFIIKDTTTTLYTITDTAVAIAHFIDAMGTDRTAAAWPGSNSPKTGLVFSTTAFRWFSTAVGRPIAHLRIVQEQTVPDPTIRVPNLRPRIFAPGTSR